MAGRLPKDDLLADPVRFAILRAVEESPGISPQEVRHKLSLGKTAMNHHRHILREAGLLREERAGRRVVLTTWTNRAVPTHSLRGSAKDVAIQLAAAEAEGLTAEELAAKVGLAPRTVRGHLNKVALASLAVGDRGKPCRFRASAALYHALRQN